jgi:hypothetical protein
LLQRGVRLPDRHGLGDGYWLIDVSPISARMMRDILGLLMRASAHVSSGHVKLGVPALARSRELPLMGVLQAKPGEDIAADPLRARCCWRRQAWTRNRRGA